MIPSQYSVAKDFYDRVSNSSQIDSYLPPSITGHSLGGALAQLVGATTGAETHAYNAPGVKSIIEDYQSIFGNFSEKDYSHINNHNAFFDPVSKVDSQIGNINNTFVSTLDYVPDWLEPLVFLELHPVSLLYYLYKQHSIGSLIDRIQSLFNQAETTSSPLILDLDGDGVETLSQAANIHFDHDGNGFAELTGWVAADDALLVLDRNENGLIDNGSELFGNKTVLASGNKAANGFGALKELDTNNDGKIDASDEAYTSLRLWQDANINGISEAGELYTLTELGIQSINTSYTNGTLTDSNGNKHLQLGNFTRTDGSVAKVTDVWFTTDYARTQAVEQLAVSEDIAALPDILAFGNVYSLHQAMVRDTTGQLQLILNNFINESDIQTRHELLDELILKWTNSDQYSVTSRGSYIADGRKLYAIEEFLGEKFTQGSGINNPGPNASAVLMEAYRSLHNTLYSQLILKTHYEFIINKLSITIIDGEIRLDTTDIVNYIESIYQQNNSNSYNQIIEFGIALKSYGAAGEEILKSIKSSDVSSNDSFNLLISTLEFYQLTGTSNKEAINGTNRDEFIIGLSGNDTLYGNSGNDLLDGGTDNDYLEGGAGSDTYLLRKGSGQDSIYQYDTAANTAALDVVRFEDVEATELTGVYRSGYNLILTYGDSDQLTLLDHYRNGYYQLDQFQFAGGVNLSVTELAQLYTIQLTGNSGSFGFTGANETIEALAGNDILYAGSGDDLVFAKAGNDQLYGENGDDFLDGGEGNDSLYGENGNDTLDGGLGNDYLVGSSGSDTYLFNLGDGKDTIYNYDTESSSIDKLVFGAGTSIDKLWFEKNGNDLQVSILDTTDSVLIKNWFLNQSYKLDFFESNDGDILYASNVQSLINAQENFENNSNLNTSLIELTAQLGEIAEEYWV